MGGCVTRYRELTLTADSIDAKLEPGAVNFYAFSLTPEWLARKRDLVVRVHVRQGRLRGVYCARDKPFPNQRRKVWEAERYCACPSRTCDHCYPDCLNAEGGVCTDCRLHDDKWERLAHEAALGGVAAELGSLSKMPDGSDLSSEVEFAAGGDPSGDAAAAANDDDADAAAANPAAASGRLLDPPYPHQKDYEFSLRLSPLSAEQAPHLAPGRFFLSVLAAEERVSRALRKQRILDGEPATHATLLTVWIEERLPRGDARLGNSERVAVAAERAQERQEALKQRDVAAHKLELAQQERREQHIMQQQLGIDEQQQQKQQQRRTGKEAPSTPQHDTRIQENKHDDL